MMSRSGNYVTQLEGYKAFIPTPLPPQPALVIDDSRMRTHEFAVTQLARLDGLSYLLPNTDLFIAMYVKKEALLSAQIEGTQASLEDLFEYESGASVDNINDVQEVVNYVKALNYGIERLKTFPMSIRLIKELHAMLLKGTRGEHKTPGELKQTQNWIGGTGPFGLKDAFFIPPPPKESMEALAQLETYMHDTTPYPELIKCALLHYQFETIHPFLDGNGRLGRLLITLYLYWKGVLEKPLLYSSYYLKMHRQEYFDRLTMVRNSGNYEQWVDFFLQAIIEASQSATDTTKRILTLQKQHQLLLWEGKVSSPAATVLLERLLHAPVATISEIEEQFGVSYPTAANMIQQFVELGILKETTGQKRAKRFVYAQYLEILSEGAQPYPAK